MKYLAFVRTAAAVLSSAIVGAAIAQVAPTVRSDMAPAPAEDRSSVGAIIMMDQPVLAQREAMQQALSAGPDTRSMGAGPAILLRKAQTKEELEAEKALEAGGLQRNGGAARTPK